MSLGRVVLAMPAVFAEHMVTTLESLGLGHNVRFHDISMGPLRPETLTPAEVLVVSGGRIGRQEIAAAPRLRLIQKWGSGTDEVDRVAAAEAGVTVAAVVGANAVSVAEHFFALLLALSRRILDGALGTRHAEWRQSQLIQAGITDLSGSVLGIIGFGAIGREIASRALSFGMEVLYNRRSGPDVSEVRRRISYASLSALAAASDVICVAAALNPSSSGLVDRRFLSVVKEGALLVNVARGGLINEEAIVDALESGQLGGFAADVLRVEPFVSSRLSEHPGVILTPHVAGRSKGAMREMSRRSAANVARALNGHTRDIDGILFFDDSRRSHG